ncbi:LytTR family DNA-binding domain-containing protein [Flavobacteriaceae bacterium S356]|uniref:LytTR family DNA-binding domain-containing protein n=1 Tax=Asprobacillus argus TaxID=3076534 RepID=A0ABU3LC52_9FLAO|nr:LytTR family DNA-binding domain-containing protein [Flavobacteriaceae bacterium S356]
MKCLIIDDDATARLIVRQLCDGFDSISIVEEFSNAIDAMKFLNSDASIDAIFLDIHMPSFSGFDFIQTLKSPPKIILTTSDRNFALDAFEYDCVVDYLVKPITKERFDKAIGKLKNFKMPNQQDSSKANTDTESIDELYVNVDRRLVKISFSDINIIEAKGDYIKIKTNDKSHIVHSTLKKIEDKLPNETFLKVHRSYIINLSKIIDIEDNSVLIKQDIIPVSRSNRSELMKRLNLL